MKLFFTLFCVFSISSFAAADDHPTHYKFVCGDTVHKVPFDPRDQAGTLINQDVTGEATLRASEQSSSRDRVAYLVKVNLTDSTITGSPEMKNLIFNCDFKRGSFGQMTCYDQSAVTYPFDSGINMFLLSIVIPDSLSMSPLGSWPGMVGIRKAQTITHENSRGERFQQIRREMDCRVL